jgi:histidinol dehydrogenase
MDAACAEVPPALLAALEVAATRIEAFHRAQLPRDLELPAEDGVALGCGGTRWMRWALRARAARRPIPPRC